MVFDESLHVEVNNDYHCAKWMKSDPEASDNLRGPVSNDVSFCTYILMAFTCKVSLPLELQHMIGLCSENLWCIPSLRAKFETHWSFPVSQTRTEHFHHRGHAVGVRTRPEM